MNQEMLANQPTNRAFSEFSELFPTAKIQEVNRTEIPKSAIEFFENESRMYILDTDYIPENFNTYFRIDHDNGDTTFVATQTKTYRDGVKEQEAYLIDFRGDQRLGHGEVRYRDITDEPYFKNKPFVGFTQTEGSPIPLDKTNTGFQKQGLGTRRLYLMNALSQQMYHLPIHSDTTITDSAQSVWKKLVEQKEAKVYKEGKHDRYVFLNKNETK